MSVTLNAKVNLLVLVAGGGRWVRLDERGGRRREIDERDHHMRITSQHPWLRNSTLNHRQEAAIGSMHHLHVVRDGSMRICSIAAHDRRPAENRAGDTGGWARSRAVSDAEGSEGGGRVRAVEGGRA